MSKFTDRLWQDLVHEHGATLAHGARPEAGRARILRRPRVLAGSTLGLAGVGTALGLLFGGGTPAFAVTRTGNDSVLVTLSQYGHTAPGVNAQLASMGINERIWYQMAPGAATDNTPIACTPGTPGATVSGPQVKVLLGTDNTYVVPSGNTGAGTWHLAACYVDNATTGTSGNAGNS